jgi:hypothetical protein
VSEGRKHDSLRCLSVAGYGDWGAFPSVVEFCFLLSYTFFDIGFGVISSWHEIDYVT